MWGNGSVPRCPWYLLLCSTDGPVCSYMWCPLVVEARMPSCSVKSLCDTLDCSPLHSSVRGIFPDKNTGVGNHSLLQGIIPSQGSNPGLPHCRQILYQLSYQGCTYSLVCLPCQLQLVMQRPWSLMIRVHFCPPGHGTTEWFQIGKGVHQAVYCHLAYLTYRQSTSSKMLGWMKHKLESRLLGEISITSDMQMTLPYGRKWRRTEEPLDENERGDWKSCLKTQHSEN